MLHGQASQYLHPRSLISAFVIRFLESNICNLATGEISNHKLVSVAEETGLKLSRKPEGRFSRDEAHFMVVNCYSSLCFQANSEDYNNLS